MLFREYNTERGSWACAYDAILFFLAYTSFSYLFSFGMALVIEIPTRSLYKEFLYKKPITSNIEETYFNNNAINDEEIVDYTRETEKILKKKKASKDKNKKTEKNEDRLKILDDDDDEDLFDSNATISELVK